MPTRSSNISYAGDGIDIPPDINESYKHFQSLANRFGFWLKNVGDAAMMSFF
jgi:hypothetical protein